MATAEGYLRRLTRRLTEDPEQLDVEELSDEAANTGAQRAIDCRRGQEVTMVGTLRSVETNAKDALPGGVRAELFDGTDTVMLVWLGQRRIPGIESGRTLRVHGRAGKLENGTKAIYNPHYEIQSGEPGASPGKHTTSALGVPPARGGLLAQMGGVSGLIYSSLPVVVFVPVSTAFGLVPAIGAALGVAALILVWRLARRESTQPAISGFIGVGVCALIAYLVGEVKGYFLLGIWASLFWATVFALSVLIRRPVVGYVWGWVNGHDRGGARCARRCWPSTSPPSPGCSYSDRGFVVQHHLYDADRTGWLGVARIAMGWPLTAVRRW